MTITASGVNTDVRVLYKPNLFQSRYLLIKIYDILEKMTFSHVLAGLQYKWTALTLCKSIESAKQWFQIQHRTTYATIQDPAVYFSGARVSIFLTLVPRL